MIENVPKIKFTGTKVVLLNKNTNEQLTIDCSDAGVFFSNFKEKTSNLQQSDDLNDWLIFYAVPTEESVIEPITEEVAHG